jgi:hypothetical protein
MSKQNSTSLKSSEKDPIIIFRQDTSIHKISVQPVLENIPFELVSQSTMNIYDLDLMDSILMIILNFPQLMSSIPFGMVSYLDCWRLYCVSQEELLKSNP